MERQQKTAALVARSVSKISKSSRYWWILSRATLRAKRYAVRLTGHELSDNVPNHVFSQRSVFATARANEAGEVASGAVLHDNVQRCGAPVDNAIVVLDNIGVSQTLEDVDLADKQLLLLVAHRAVVQRLCNQQTAIGATPHPSHSAKATLADSVDNLVLLRQRFTRCRTHFAYVVRLGLGSAGEREFESFECTHCIPTIDK